MSTLQNCRRRYFNWRNSGVVFFAHILVIAFVVKAHSFESKSDNFVRQALRQQELIKSVKKDLKLSDEIGTDAVFAVPDDNGGVVDSHQKSEAILREAYEWEKKHPSKKIVGVFLLATTVFSEGKILLKDGSFEPIGAYIFFKNEE